MFTLKRTEARGESLVRVILEGNGVNPIPKQAGMRKPGQGCPALAAWKAYVRRFGSNCKLRLHDQRTLKEQPRRDDERQFEQATVSAPASIP